MLYNGTRFSGLPCTCDSRVGHTGSRHSREATCPGIQTSDSPDSQVKGAKMLWPQNLSGAFTREQNLTINRPPVVRPRKPEQGGNGITYNTDFSFK